MALELATVLWIVKDNGGTKEVVSTEIPDDTIASRNQGLTTLGFPNNTNKDPVLNDRQFINKFTHDYPTVLNMLCVDCIKNTVNNRYYFLHEIISEEIVVNNEWKSKEKKKEKIKDNSNIDVNE
jgi:hypothetical protein